jgi:EmrB/QacA subfamily drug resistance transporter
MEYKWIALSNTTLGTLMASIDITIVLIALPAIFRGINIDPLNSFQYLLWMLFGYMVVTATLLVTFGRISDMYGRVRFYNLGFAIYTVGSLLLYLTPNTGDLGAMELIVFRVVQGIGGAFIFSNSPAIITDAFPLNERGKALGINGVSFLVGSLIGLILGGVLAVYDWRYVFLISVPFGVFGTVWSYWKLKELGIIRRQKLDVWGNITFGLGLTVVLIAVTYGLLPYGGSPMGWSNPWVIAGLIAGTGLLIVFIVIERHVPEPMFRLELFRIRMFAYGNIANLFSSIARGAVMFMLIILLQAIWLPLHGYSYESTPFWAGIYMIPMSIGSFIFGPISGALSDRYGARGLATLGMSIGAASLVALTFLPYNFDYVYLALIIFFSGVGMGMFMSPNTASIMNSVPPEHRGVASGMRSTLQNVGQLVSLVLFFGIVITALEMSLPQTLASAMASAGAPQLEGALANISPTGALFAAFLGYNPMQTTLSQLPPNIFGSLNGSTIETLTSLTWFPRAIASTLMSALKVSFYAGAALSVVGAIVSALRGKTKMMGEGNLLEKQ